MPPELVQFLTNASSPVAVAGLVLWFWQRDVKARDDALTEQRQQEREDKLLLIQTLQEVAKANSEVADLRYIIREVAKQLGKQVPDERPSAG